MIDYLELLLERQEPEESGEALKWTQKAAVSAPRRRAAEDGGADAGFKAGAGPELPAQTAAEAAVWAAVKAGSGSRVFDTRTGARTSTGRINDLETAGAYIEQAAEVEAMRKQEESDSAVSLFRVWETALPMPTGGPARSGAPRLYRQMAQAGRAAVGLRYSTRLVTVAESSSPSPGLGAEELDELFSRDARRYDGGFSLF